MKRNLSLFGVRLSLVCLVVLFSVSVYAQAPQKADVRSAIKLELDSKLMARGMPYEVVLPKSYDKKSKKPYPVVYLLHGLTGHYDNWIGNSDLLKVSEQYGYVFVMPEGDNGWYTDSPVKANDKYESYIIDELIPAIEAKYNVSKERDGRAVAGLSMGGYGGLKFGLKYPDKFVLAGSFSGALRAAEWDQTTVPVWKVLGDSVMSAFGSADSPTREKNDLFKILNAKSAEDVKSLPFLYIDCGTEDPLVIQNREFSESLLKKKVPHEFRQLPGRHDWKFWDSQVDEFLELSARLLK